ncbi:MAG TPA: DUF4190 domain-containing protein [Pseudolysinimonas sp.]|nr:DUF4190 domain-containing protein [Pseudolysinimonas sp.]
MERPEAAAAPESAPEPPLATQPEPPPAPEPEPEPNIMLDTPILPPLSLSPDPAGPALTAAAPAPGPAAAEPVVAGPVAPPEPRIGPLARVLEMTSTRSRRARAAREDDDAEGPRSRRSRPLPAPVLIPDTTGPILAAPFTQPASLTEPELEVSEDAEDEPAAEGAVESESAHQAAAEPDTDNDTRSTGIIDDLGEADLSIHHLELPELTFPERDAHAPELGTEFSTASAPIAILTSPESTAESASHTVSEVHADVEAWEDEDWDEDDRAGSVNTLAIIALAMGVLASPLAALFGHLALSQLKVSAERGVTPAWIAIVLGYLWLGAWIVFGISYLMTNG